MALATFALHLPFHTEFQTQMNKFAPALLQYCFSVQTGGTKGCCCCLWRKFRPLHLSRCSDELAATHKHNRADDEKHSQLLKKLVTSQGQHEPESGYGDLFILLSFLGWQGGRHFFFFSLFSFFLFFFLFKSCKQNKIFLFTLANGRMFPSL